LRNILIVGGGIAGISTALALSGLNASVDLVERSPTIRTLGSGITLIAPAMRALDRLGVLDDCLQHGYGTSEFQVRDLEDEVLMVIPLPSPLDSNLPGVMGMMRPTLHQILIDRAALAGLNVRTGLTPDRLDDHEDGVTVAFSDGSAAEYDLVIGADGLRSTVRELVSGPIMPTFQGQVCYRVVAERPASITTEVAYIGSGTTHVGFTPTGQDTMYLYCLLPSDDQTRPPDAELPDIVRRHLEPFGGAVAEVRKNLTDSAKVNFTTLDTVIAPRPWNRGRTVLVGDSAHSTTPHIAAGAAMCLEDAIVLSEELVNHASIAEALQAYSTRRYDRCKYVVETSAQLGYWQTHPGAPAADQEGLRTAAIEVLAGPF
jgi:2-polyprenyl-6-methoxyphenol hydroxylase-like FAD-dependent oxidoreductase